jgi:hypothetical protein
MLPHSIMELGKSLYVLVVQCEIQVTESGSQGAQLISDAVDNRLSILVVLGFFKITRYRVPHRPIQFVYEGDKGELAILGHLYVYTE